MWPVMRLHQLKVEFDAEQDRLLMRILIDGGSEVSVWLTRRCVKRLWEALLKMAEWKPEIQLQATEEARKAVLHFEHEKALQEVKFSRPCEDEAVSTVPRTRPLGPEPLLITRIQARRTPEGRTQLALLPNEGQGAHLSLNDNLLHGLMRLVQSAVAKAEWELILELPKSGVLAMAEGERTIN